MIKGYKIRIYPTKDQATLIMKHIGACRFIWNYMIDLQLACKENGTKRLSGFDMNKLVTKLKKHNEYQWLREVSNTSLYRVCNDLNVAYQAFFDGRNNFVKYKTRKKSKMSYPVRCDDVHFNDKYVHLSKLGNVRYRSDFDIVNMKCQKYIDVRVSLVNGKYMLSFSVECDNQAPVLNEYSLGIDLGVKELAVCAYNGNELVFHNINKSKTVRNIKQQIRRRQRRLSRKYKASMNRNNGICKKTNNIIKEENRIRKLYARLSNIRSNYIHQVTHQIISLRPNIVVMEDLNVLGMLKNRHLSASILEQCFSEFRRQMQYKCEWNNIEFRLADRFYPSSKTCSSCGSIKQHLKLSERTFCCEECGLRIDRDFNAAINLSKYIA